MLNFLPGPVIGGISLALYVLNTLFWCGILFFLALLKFAGPSEKWRNLCNMLLNTVANCWISCNNANMALTKKITWDVRGIENLDPKEWYLVLSNHQSWVDILVLQKVFHRKVPFLKFFLKKELIWVPILGLAWWALEFPFMKRYTQEYLKRHPQHKGKDLEITRRACERFKKLPISVMNFVEGTRFTPHKHKKQGSPYMNLLRPKAGGVAFVLSAMGQQLHLILNVTILYPCGVKSFWQFICAKTNEVVVRVEALPITGDLIGDYAGDPEFRDRFQEWLNAVWLEKDLAIEEFSRERRKAA